MYAKMNACLLIETPSVLAADGLRLSDAAGAGYVADAASDLAIRMGCAVHQGAFMACMIRMLRKWTYNGKMRSTGTRGFCST
jgi:hypothetical protein